MSIAFKNNPKIDMESQSSSSGFVCSGSFNLIFDSPVEDRRITVAAGEERKELNECNNENTPSLSLSLSLSSSSSSSIGNNSDLSSDGEGNCGDDEAQSSFKEPLDMMDALEEVLPFRRGISNFYNGKSKSFTTLEDATICSTVKEIAKPENAYTRKRRNLLAFNHIWEKNRGCSLRGNGSGISKRPLISSSRSTLALAVALSSSESLSSNSETSSSNSSPFSRSPPPLPPLHPQSRVSHHTINKISSSPPRSLRNLSTWRSYSLADLQH